MKKTDQREVSLERTVTSGQWWRSPFELFQTNLREIDADMDVEATADFIVAHGASAWLFGVGGILSYYPSDLDFQTRNPFLSGRPSGDLVGDAITAAHARGLRFVARMDFSKISAKIAAEHPEWCFISPDGSLQTHTGDLVSVCPSGQYYQSRVFDIIDEIIERYPVDGFFFNWFGFNEVDYNKAYHGVCQCVSCQEGFAEFGGGQLPTGPESPGYTQWLGFAEEVIDGVTARVRNHLDARLPDAGLILGRAADIMFQEANNAVGRDFWPYATAEGVSASRSYRPDVPVMVHAVEFFDMPYRMASEETSRVGQYLVQALSRGANPSTYIMGAPGRIPYAGLPIAGEITRFHRRWREVYEHFVPAARTALVRPSLLAQTQEAFDSASLEFRGLYLSLQQKHVPFDVIPMEHIADMADNGSLARYALVVLPDVGELAQDAAAALDGFVDLGGNLLGTGVSGLAFGGVQLSASPALEPRELLEGFALWSSYIAATPVGLAADHFEAPIVPVFGGYRSFDWKADSIAYRTFLPQAPFAPPEKAYGHRPSHDPGYVVAPYGRGRGALIPWTTGRAYLELGLTAIRDSFIEVVGTLLDGAETLVFDVPEQVEITVHQSNAGLVVHLVNMSGVRSANFGPTVPIRGARISGAALGGVARALVADRDVTPANDSGVVVPDFDLFEVIVFSTP
ncbi:MAG: hypothetical protein JWP19_2328 [Rhodoglobus sp.]|nr:hypothetical protein [Rhodoglobus sp.]